jgi:hypothetical protein
MRWQISANLSLPEKLIFPSKNLLNFDKLSINLLANASVFCKETETKYLSKINYPFTGKATIAVFLDRCLFPVSCSLSPLRN